MTGNKRRRALGQRCSVLSVQTPNGVRYAQRRVCERLTGTIVTQDGNPVLNTQGQPIVLADNGGDVTISPDGTVTQTATGTAAAPDRAASNGAVCSLLNMRPEAKQFRAMERRWRTCGRLHGRARLLERSNSSPIRSMVDLITAERWFDMNEKSIKTQDDATNAAISIVARPSQ